MQVNISGLVGRAPKCLPDDSSSLEAALAVLTNDGKDWFAVRFSDAFIEAAQTIRKGDTIAVTGELTFEPLPDSSTVLFKPVVTVSDL
jgi:hypothetical protein